VTLPKDDSGTRVTFTVQVTQGTAYKVTEITTEIRRLNVVPIRDLRSVEGQYTAVASSIFTGTPFPKPLRATLTVDAQLSESLEWVHTYLISEDDPFQKYTSPKRNLDMARESAHLTHYRPLRHEFRTHCRVKTLLVLCLAVLVALRLWLAPRREARVC